jgi:hypothetical protein
MGSAGLNAFGADGFTVGNDTDENNNGNLYASWNWKAGTTSGIATNGSTTITPSAYSFNQTAGFSIIKYTGNATAGAKVAHGLGATPALIIVKITSGTNNWVVYHHKMNKGVTPHQYAMYLDSTHIGTDDAWMNDTAPDSVNFTLSGGNYANTSATHVAYCFAEKTGYSKFGLYCGTGIVASPGFAYTGFKPKFVIVKKSTGSTDSWFMHDNKRDGHNDDNEYLFPDLNTAEGTNVNRIRLLSNGFSNPTTDKSHNNNNSTYIYIAFGQTMVGTNNVPCTAN